jgi:cytochrome P450
MLSIIALLSGRVFVGPELGRNEEYQDCTVGYTLDSFNAANKIRAWHPILRPFIYRFVPEYRAVQRELATLTRLVTPLVDERLKGNQNGAPNMMDWNMNNSPSLKRHDVKYQAMQQLQVSFLAIHTTAKLLTNVCFDLAAHPEYLQLLRDELEEVLNTTGGQLSKAALLKLKKMDSIMSETQRHNPPGIMTFNRKATSSLELSNGLHIPSGTYLAAASSQIAMDSEHWDTPEKYDGLRFYRMRQEPGCENKYQVYSSMSKWSSLSAVN